MSDTMDRFWQKVDKTDSCWLWTGALHRGYGVFTSTSPRKTFRAHRLSYELTVGPIPGGMDLDHRHTCPKRCVNPDHLRPATHKQNLENLCGARRDSVSGVRGVRWIERLGKFQAYAYHNGKAVNGGLHLTIEDAHAAAVALRNSLFTHNDADRVDSKV